MHATSTRRRRNGSPARSRPSRSAKARALLTLGYEGLSPDQYFAALRRAGATILCDVRANAFSRKPGFSKRALAERAAAESIAYEHRPALGIPSARRKDVETDEQRDALFDWYETHVLPNASDGIGEIASWIRDGQRVALTCYERDPADCHRHRLSKAVARRARVKVVDLPDPAASHVAGGLQPAGPAALKAAGYVKPKRGACRGIASPRTADRSKPAE
jgi:uncharacterized protein (DUF488 family)